MKLDNKQVFDFFKVKQIEKLYHANTVTTSCTYIEHNGLLSRGAVGNLGLLQTPQASDDIDKIINVWNDVFIDTADLHTYFGRQNYYGPILFEFNCDLILNKNYDIWITKNNPLYWKAETPDENKYFQNIEELNELWDKIPRQKKMITIRNNSAPILFEYVDKIIVDDPRVQIPDGKGGNINLFNQTVEKVKSKVPNNHVLKGKFITRSDCTNCFCRSNYLKQLNHSQLKNLFL